MKSESLSSTLEDIPRTVWPGLSRPTPAEVRTAAYDVGRSLFPDRKLLICAAPRTSSKRLARLLLGAGMGVPMEYFNPSSFRTLTARWGIRKRDYLRTLYRLRSINGVFTTNLQHHQIRSWSYPHDFADLFDQAMVIYLVRRDRVAQAASLATCILTGNWGFISATPERLFPERKLRKAVRRALTLIDEEDRGWARLFADWGITPMPATDEQVNRDDLGLVDEIATRLGLPFDREGAASMLRFDEGPYRVNEELKARLRAMVEEVWERP